MNTYKLSIVIPVFNKLNFTKSCLKDLSLLPQDHEIIVINNNSSDDTGAYLDQLKSSMPNLTVVNFAENKGFGFACNWGYNIAQSENVLFLNNDIKVKSNFENWTLPLINNCKNGLTGPTMGLLNKNLTFLKEENSQLTGLSYLSGWCLAGSKTNFNKLILKNFFGPFDANLFAYYEDTDLSFRAKELKIPLIFCDVPVVHFGKITSSQLNTGKLYSESQKYFLKKWKK